PFRGNRGRTGNPRLAPRLPHRSWQRCGKRWLQRGNRTRRGRTLRTLPRGHSGGVGMKPPTRAPFYAAMYHGLCDVARARGYARAIHGTVTSDLDLLACPWTDQARSAELLRAALMEHINACDYEQSLVRFGLSPEHA